MDVDDILARNAHRARRNRLSNGKDTPLHVINGRVVDIDGPDTDLIVVNGYNNVGNPTTTNNSNVEPTSPYVTSPLADETDNLLSVHSSPDIRGVREPLGASLDLLNVPNDDLDNTDLPRTTRHGAERSGIHGDLSMNANNIFDGESTKSTHRSNKGNPNALIESFSDLPPPTTLDVIRDEYDKSHNNGPPPYLSIGSKMARALFTQANVSFIIVVYTLVYLYTQLKGISSDVKTTLASTCTGMETAVSSLGSASYYATTGTNALVQSSTKEVYSGLLNGLDISINLVKYIVIFVIERYQKLLLCLVDALIATGQSLVTEYATEISTFLNKTLISVENKLNSEVDSINSLLNQVYTSSLATSIESLFGADSVTDDSANINLSSVTDILNFTLPSDFSEKLVSFVDSIPTLDDYYELVEKTVSIPFDELQEYLNKTFTEMSTNNANLLDTAKTPQSYLEVDLCSGVDYGWVDTATEGLQSGIVLAVGLFCLVFIFVIVFNFSQTIYDQWQLTRRIDQIGTLIKEHDHLKNNPNSKQKEGDLLQQNNENFAAREHAENIVHAATSPMMWKFGIYFGRLFKSLRAQRRAMWFFNFVNHPPSLVCIFAGISGLLCICLQLVFINLVRDQSPVIAEQATFGISDMAVKMTVAVDESATPYVNSVNSWIEDTEDKFNSKMSSWVNTTVTTVNDTINEIEAMAEDVMDYVVPADGNSIQTTVRSVFQSWINCVLGKTINGIEKTLTYMEEHASVTFPKLSTDIFVKLNQTQAQSILNTAAYRMYAAIANSSSSDNTTLTRRDIDDSMTADQIIELEFNYLLSQYQSIVEESKTIFIILIAVGFVVPIMAILRLILWGLSDMFNSGALQRVKLFFYGYWITLTEKFSRKKYAPYIIPTSKPEVSLPIASPEIQAKVMQMSKLSSGTSTVTKTANVDDYSSRLERRSSDSSIPSGRSYKRRDSTEIDVGNLIDIASVHTRSRQNSSVGPIPTVFHRRTDLLTSPTYSQPLTYGIPTSPRTGRRTSMQLIDPNRRTSQGITILAERAQTQPRTLNKGAASLFSQLGMTTSSQSQANFTKGSTEEVIIRNGRPQPNVMATRPYLRNETGGDMSSSHSLTGSSNDLHSGNNSNDLLNNRNERPVSPRPASPRPERDGAWFLRTLQQKPPQ